MKKLLFPILISIMLIMFFGCKSDTPVQANNDGGVVASLQKPSPNFDAEYSDPYVHVSWNSYGGAKSYVLSRSNSASGPWTLVQINNVQHGVKTYNYYLNWSAFASGTYYLRLQAYNGKNELLRNASWVDYAVKP